MLMSGIEIITDGGRRRRWSAAEKLRHDETLQGHDSISAFARRNGVAPNLLHRWRKLMLEGGSIAVSWNASLGARRLRRPQHDQGFPASWHSGRLVPSFSMADDGSFLARSGGSDWGG